MRSLIQDFLRRVAYREGKAHIYECERWGAESHSLELRPLAALLKPLSSDLNFERGYSAAWSELGEADASEGRCRAARFRQHGYNLGWAGEMQRLYSLGWRHDRLEPEWLLMQQHYFGNIQSGQSEKYYQVCSQQ